MFVIRGIALVMVGLTLFVGCGPAQVSTSVNSLTDESFIAKKYYFGWGVASDYDPANMHAEVAFDVKHTHDVFSSENGGNYLGKTLVGVRQATGDAIRSSLSEFKNRVSEHDMYIQ